MAPSFSGNWPIKTIGIMGMQKFFQKQHRWIGLSVGAHFAFVVVAYATEIPQISKAQKTEPTCVALGQYLDQPIPPAPVGSGPPSSVCQNCKTTIQQAVETANKALDAAIAEDASIAAANAANTQTSATLAGLDATQNGDMFRTGDVNSSGFTAAKQQEALANRAAGAYEQCASQIDSACANVAPNDKALADQAKRSCQSSAQQARQVAADKAAKAAEMAKNGQQANQSGQGMQPPQMPPGGSGEPATGSTDPYDSKISSSVEKAKTAKLDSGFSGGKAEIPNGQEIESGLSSAQNSANTVNGSNPGQSREAKAKIAATNTASGGSGGSRGISGSSTAGGFGSSDGSKSSEEKADALAIIKGSAGEDPLAAGGGSNFKPTLGLKSSGDELADLMNQQNANTGSSVLGGSLEATGQSLAAHSGSLAAGGDEVSLFKRIKSKITSLSRARNMQ